MLYVVIVVVCLVVGHWHGWVEAKAKYEPDRIVECEHCGQDTSSRQNKGWV